MVELRNASLAQLRALTYFEVSFYNDVQHPFLRGALDRFAQFFLCPLFGPSATEVRLAVGSNPRSQQPNEPPCHS